MDSDNSSADANDRYDRDSDASRGDAIDDALEIAFAQSDFMTISRLAFEQSLRFHRNEQYFAAVEYSDVALVAWRAHFDKAPSDVLAVARPTELRILNAAATQNFNQGRFGVTADLIQQARRLTPFLPGISFIASTEWNTALMERWRGDYSTALQHALRAGEIHRANSASPLNLARVRLFIAQIANDCAAEAAKQGATQLVDRYLRVARGHLLGATPPPGSRHAPAVEGNLRLIYAAFSRLTGKNEDRLGMLHTIIPLAHALRDPILEGQVYTALGDEYTFQRRTAEARTCYLIAFEILLSSHAPSLAVWPLRPLKQEWEYSLDRFAGALR
jgi:tetratricopeptide (TPR) repeat protein